MKKFNKGDWVLTPFHQRKGIVVGFESPPAREIECAWILLIGDSSPCLFDLRFIKRIEVENET